MMARTHLLLGTSVFFGAQGIMYPGISDAAMLCALGGIWAGSLVPDIDHSQSYLGRRLGPLFLVSRMFTHRGATHSLFFCALTSSLLYYLCVLYPEIPFYLVQGFFVGYLLHVLADLMTDAGVSLFWPLSKRVTCNVINMKTGGGKEKILNLILLGLTITMVYINIFVDRIMV